MEIKGFAAALLIGVFLHCASCELPRYINVDKLRKIFDANIKAIDPANFAYAVKGYNLLKVPYPSSVCQDHKNLKYDLSKIEEVYYIASAAALTKCQNNLAVEVMKAANAVLESKDASLADLFYAVKTLKALGKETAFDKEEGFKGLIERLRKDDSLANNGFLMQMCLELDCGAWLETKTPIILNQADEIDGTMLQFEGGLPVTANILTGILKKYSSVGKANPLTQEQLKKFVQYLLYRSSVNTPKGAALLLETAITIIEDKSNNIVPITIKGKHTIQSSEDLIYLQATDLLGRPVKNAALTLESATRMDDGVVVASKKKLTEKGDVFEFKLPTTTVGKYKIIASNGQSSSTLYVIVQTPLRITDAGLGIADLDGATQTQYLQVTYPNTHANVLSADHLHKISLKFRVTDDTGKPYVVKQPFAKIASKTKEVIFVAETDKDLAYKVDIQVSVLSQHFNHESGLYELELIVGDPYSSVSLLWTVAKFQLTFVDKPKQAAEARSSLQPEITHKFRDPEPRPPRIVSDVFSLAALSPLLLLLILWAAIGINVKDFPFTLSALVFHLGLGATLGLLVLFWLQLNMFETVRYLLALGLITFVSGHRLLRHLVKTNKF